MGKESSASAVKPVMTQKNPGREIKKRNRFTKPEWSWMFYDWANSVYATNIMAAIFPAYFTAVCIKAGYEGSVWWGYGSSIATLVVALLAPFLGAIGDYKGMKKKLLTVFMAIGVVFTLMMAIFDNWQMMLVGYVLSYIGFTGGNLFYDSFLTDVTTEERMDKVSAAGYAMGYIGGSTIPFLISIVIIMTLGKTDMPLAIKIAVILTSVWWAAFSLPILLNVHQTHYVEVPKTRFVRNTLLSVLNTAKEIFKNKGIFVFVLAYFFYIDGVNTVIHMATAYGGTLGLDTTKMIMALLVTQLVAVPCSILFSRLAGKFGAMRMILFAVCMYTFICIVGYYMGYSIESAPANPLLHAAAVSRAQTLFWIMAGLVGTVQGGIQALSRSYYGKLIPPERSNEFFGFFDIFGKFAAVIGPSLYALITSVTHSAATGIISVSVLFIIAFIILVAGRRYLKTAEKV